MNTATHTALTAAATAHATSRLDAAKKTIATGRKTFVKGKPVMVAYSADFIANMVRLQRFTTDDSATRAPSGSA